MAKLKQTGKNRNKAVLFSFSGNSAQIQAFYDGGYDVKKIHCIFKKKLDSPTKL